MKNNNGFTLLELLIAATIIGALAVLATVSYRASESDAHAAAARAKVDVLAAGVQQFLLEREHAAAPVGEMSNLNGIGNCSPATTGTNPATVLIQCDFVDNGGWDNPYFHFYVCGGTSDLCSGHSTGVTNPRACMRGKGHSRMTGQYQTNYWYCVSDTTSGEHFSS